MLKILKIKGNSMEPLLKDGDFVFATRFPSLHLYLKVGKVVIFRFKDEIYVKQIAVIKENAVRVEGLHPFSMTQAEFGDISFKDIVGVVFYRVK